LLISISKISLRWAIYELLVDNHLRNLSEMVYRCASCCYISIPTISQRWVIDELLVDKHLQNLSEMVNR
jgi:hypothetical protein